MMALFEMGLLVATPGVLSEVDYASQGIALRRHATGDWGLVDDADKALNDAALHNGDRLLSAYCAQNGTLFWIITEADRSATTLLLPDEY